LNEIDKSLEYSEDLMESERRSAPAHHWTHDYVMDNRPEMTDDDDYVDDYVISPMYGIQPRTSICTVCGGKGNDWSDSAKHYMICNNCNGTGYV
jgi:hypothetical protein